jgi:hypothetical protein
MLQRLRSAPPDPSHPAADVGWTLDHTRSYEARKLLAEHSRYIVKAARLVEEEAVLRQRGRAGHPQRTAYSGPT